MRASWRYYAFLQDKSAKYISLLNTIIIVVPDRKQWLKYNKQKYAVVFKHNLKKCLEALLFAKQQSL